MIFNIGKVVFTCGVSEMMKTNPDFYNFVMGSFERYKKGIWGDTCPDDIWINKQAISNGEEIMAEYKDGAYHIWILTDKDRKQTTVLFPSEY